MTGRLKRLVREPLVHFALIGIALFLVISAVRSHQRPLVSIDAQEIEQLATYWEAQAQRRPTRQELAGLIQERVDEELLAREALRLGLDRDDIIVRRRLAQKMAFASDDVAPVPEPDEESLRAFYARTKAAYGVPVRVALKHVYFSADRPAPVIREAAAETLLRANRGEPVSGDPSLLPTSYADVAIPELDRDYGPAFASAAAAAPVGEWRGPVESPYGLHLIQVLARREAATAPFEDVRDQVREAWYAEQREAGSARFRDELRRRYRVEVADLP